MKNKLIILFWLPILFVNAQRIGQIAPPDPPIEFPDNSLGFDVMFHEAGFGFGGFYKKNFSRKTSGFVDLSISEAKGEREIQYYDIYGIPYTIGKKNRVFLLPLIGGLQQRLFADDITENLRPYINIGIGPTLVISTPYDIELFKSFGFAEYQVAASGYIGFGANFGLSKDSLLGLNFRYYFFQFLGNGIESIEGNFQKSLGSFYLTINIGMMY